MGNTPRFGPPADPELIVIVATLPASTPEIVPPQKGTSVFKVTASGGGSVIQSIQRGADGQRVLFINMDPTNSVFFTAQSGFGDPGGQLFIPGLTSGQNLTVGPLGSVKFYFDADLFAWIAISGSSGGGGGGGSFLGVSAYPTADTSVPNNVNTPLVLAAVDFDTGAPTPFWSIANPTRLTAPLAGFYLATACFLWDQIASVRMGVIFTKNGVAANLGYSVTNNPGASGGSDMGTNLTQVFHLAAGDYLEANGFATSVTPPNTILGSANTGLNRLTTFQMIKVG